MHLSALSWTSFTKYATASTGTALECHLTVLYTKTKNRTVTVIAAAQIPAVPVQPRWTYAYLFSADLPYYSNTYTHRVVHLMILYCNLWGLPKTTGQIYWCNLAQHWNAWWLNFTDFWGHNVDIGDKVMQSNPITAKSTAQRVCAVCFMV